MDDTIKTELDKPLEKNRVKQKEVPGRDDADYLESYDVIDAANRIFGYGQWGTKIIDADLKDIGGKTIGIANVQLSVVGCEPREDVGVVIARQAQGKPLSAGAAEMAIKGAVSDAMKRCFRHFGNQFGNSLYSKEKPKAKDKAAWKAQGHPPPQEDPGQIKGVPDIKDRPAAPDAETLRDWIHSRVKEKGLEGEATEKQLGLMNGLLVSIFGTDIMAERQRHRFLDFMFGTLTSATLTKGQASALIDWAKDSVGKKPHPVAVKEGQMVVEAHEEAGQSEW